MDWNIPPRNGSALSLVLSQPMVVKQKPILIRKQYALQVPSTAGLESLWQMHKDTTPSISYSHDKQRVPQGPICKPLHHVRLIPVNTIAATHDKWKASSSVVIVIVIINVEVCKLYLSLKMGC